MTAAQYSFPSSVGCSVMSVSYVSHSAFHLCRLPYGHSAA